MTENFIFSEKQNQDELSNRKLSSSLESALDESTYYDGHSSRRKEGWHQRLNQAGQWSWFFEMMNHSLAGSRAVFSKIKTDCDCVKGVKPACHAFVFRRWWETCNRLIFTLVFWDKWKLFSNFDHLEWILATLTDPAKTNQKSKSQSVLWMSTSFYRLKLVNNAWFLRASSSTFAKDV